MLIFAAKYSRIMVLRKMKGLALILLSGVLITGCEKEEGEGGTSTIRGKVVLYDFDGSFSQVQVTFPAVDARIYIIYGADGTTFDDDKRTSYDGSYEFKYLQKGKYKLFSYSKDSTGAWNSSHSSANPDVPVFTEVEITENGSTVDAPDIIVIDNNQ